MIDFNKTIMRKVTEAYEKGLQAGNTRLFGLRLEVMKLRAENERLKSRLFWAEDPLEVDIDDLNGPELYDMILDQHRTREKERRAGLDAFNAAVDDKDDDAGR